MHNREGYVISMKVKGATLLGQKFLNCTFLVNSFQKNVLGPACGSHPLCATNLELWLGFGNQVGVLLEWWVITYDTVFILVSLACMSGYYVLEEILDFVYKCRKYTIALLSTYDLRIFFFISYLIQYSKLWSLKFTQVDLDISVLVLFVYLQAAGQVSSSER